MPSAMNLSPMPVKSGNGKLIAVVGAAAAAILTPLVATWEGKSNDPYRDIVGVMTVCYGETRVEMRRYTNAECTDMLDGALAGFAKPVLERNPELRNRPNQLAAAVSLSYNVGSANYWRSTVSRNFRDGKWVSACNGFRAWSYAGGRRVQGLINRREDERRICLRDIPADKAR